MAWKIASVPQGRFDWPTFKQNQRRTGGAIDLTAPTASFSSVPNPSASTKVTVGWTATDGQTAGEDTTGVRSFDVDVQDGAGAWTRWLSGVDPTGGSGNTATGSSALYGLPGHTYSMRVRARPRRQRRRVVGARRDDDQRRRDRGAAVPLRVCRGVQR